MNVTATGNIRSLMQPLMNARVHEQSTEMLQHLFITAATELYGTWISPPMDVTATEHYSTWFSPPIDVPAAEHYS